MKKTTILWADDEIDLLKPYVLFLEENGYEIVTVNNGEDAVEKVKTGYFDLIFLDENMPGLSGLETLDKIKKISPHTPVIMITKSEEDNTMNKAIGSKIADYLIKPVHPKQVLLAIRKNTEHKRLVTEKTTSAYQSEFRELGTKINDCMHYNHWIDIYKKLVYWELELDESKDNTLDEVLKMQKSEANLSFCKFIKKNYLSWFDPATADKPLLSPSIIKNKVMPLLRDSHVLFILVDNLRYDQWKTIQPVIEDYYQVEDETLFFSILPTATQYSRNALFSGLMPLSIQKMFPELWVFEEEEGGKNLYEEELLKHQLSRYGFNQKLYFAKVFENQFGRKQVENIKNILNYPFSTVIFNFIDTLSHAYTEMKMIRELVGDESAYRSLTRSWFEHSPLLDMLKETATQKNKPVKVVITTDHGAIRVNNPVKVIGDKNLTNNLRYKHGKSMTYNPKEVFEIMQPEKAQLPSQYSRSSYIFSTHDDFFAYTNNFNHYVQYYKNTFQHGGVSLEEMLIPFIVLNPKPAI